MQNCDSVFNSTCVGSIALAIFITLLQGLCGMSFGKFALPQLDLIEYRSDAIILFVPFLPRCAHFHNL